MIFSGLFAAVPSEAIDDLRLTGTDRKVLAAVASHDRMGGNRQGCYAGRDILAEETGINASNVSTALTRLCDLGYLLKRKRGKDARKFTYFVRYGKKFARMPWEVISDRRIHDAAFRVLGAVVMHDHSAGHGCWASRETLAKEAGLKANTVSIAMADLEAYGYIARQRSDSDARQMRTYVLAFGSPPEKVAPHQPISVAPHQPNFENESCPGEDSQLRTVNLSGGDRLPGTESLSNETNGIPTPIYSLERELINIVETKIDSVETDAVPAPKNPAEKKERGLGRKAHSTGVTFQSFTAALSKSPDVDTKIVNALAGIGVGNADSWIVLMSLPDSDVSKLRALSAEDRLSKPILIEAFNAAFKPDSFGAAAMNWAGLDAAGAR